MITSNMFKNEISEFYINAKVQFLSQHFSICADYMHSQEEWFYWKKKKKKLWGLPFICLGNIGYFNEVFLFLINS